MPSGKDLLANPWPSLLLVGDAGTHKTFFLGSLPESQTYIFDFDNGLQIIRGKGFQYDRFKDAPRGSKVINQETGIYSYGQAWPRFIDKLNDIGLLVDKGTCPYKFLCMDSLTFMADICLNYVLMSDTKYDPKDPVDPGRWFSQMKLLASVMDQLTAWPVVKVVTAHIHREKNALTENIEKLPLVTGKLAPKVPNYFDEVYFTETTGAGAAMKFVLRTQRSAVYAQAKSRFGVPDGTETDWKRVGPIVLAGQAAA